MIDGIGIRFLLALIGLGLICGGVFGLVLIRDAVSHPASHFKTTKEPLDPVELLKRIETISS